MRLLIQRVKEASVTVDGQRVSAIGAGLLVFIGVFKNDGREQAAALAKKTAALRIFEDEAGKMNLSVKDTGGSALVVSQFTLAGDTSAATAPALTTPPGRKRPNRSTNIFPNVCGPKESRCKTASFRPTWRSG